MSNTPITAQAVASLRETTGAGLLDCKKALAESNGNVEEAITILRKKGAASAAKKADRLTKEGTIESYIHVGGKVGVLIEVNCETDFVAMNDGFKALCNDIAMHIAASACDYVSKEDVPADVANREREVQKARVIEEGKPAHIADKIVEGRMSKFYEEACLVEQKFVKDVITDAIAKIGENIKVRRFSKFTLGEGLEKKTTDFAAEVAAQIGR